MKFKDGQTVTTKSGRVGVVLGYSTGGKVKVLLNAENKCPGYFPEDEIKSYTVRYGTSPAEQVTEDIRALEKITADVATNIFYGEDKNNPLNRHVDTLTERGHKYGESFAVQATTAQNIKRAMALSPNWETLPDDMRESLGMIAVKVSRILNGDPEYVDSWHDIVGYAKLIEDRLLQEEQ